MGHALQSRTLPARPRPATRSRAPAPSNGSRIAIAGPIMTAARKLNKASPQRIECHEVQDAARTLAASNEALDRSRHYYVWVDGRAYPFAPLVRAACKAAGQPEPKFDAVPTGGNSPWHRRLRALHFPVLPKGFEPVSPSNDGAGGRMPPAAVLDRRAVEA